MDSETPRGTTRDFTARELAKLAKESSETLALLREGRQDPYEWIWKAAQVILVVAMPVVGYLYQDALSELKVAQETARTNATTIAVLVERIETLTKMTDAQQAELNRREGLIQQGATNTERFQDAFDELRRRMNNLEDRR